MISPVSALLGLCVFFRAGTTYSTAQPAPVACSPVTSVDGIQPVFDKAASQKSVCVKFKGKGGAAGWSMEDAEPLSIEAGQQVVMDCAGSEFSMFSSKGNLTMGPDSSLHYVNCDLQTYVFPEGEAVRGTIHTMSNSTFDMQSCRFVENLSSQYSPLIVELQSNASFNLGELVRQGDSAAIHIFAATFDSLIGPQFRYEIFNTTAHCGPSTTIAADALQVAVSNSPDVILMSEDANTLPQQATVTVGSDPAPGDDRAAATSTAVDAGTDPAEIVNVESSGATPETGGRLAVLRVWVVAAAVAVLNRVWL